MNQPLRIATRQSPLAMWQAQHVAGRLAEYGVATTMVPLASQGDIDMRPIDGTRQVGLFTKRIQRALLEDEADIAVHSLKDLPTEHNPAFCLAAIPVRETVRDCLILRDGVSVFSGDSSSPERSAAENFALDRLPRGARVGTGSRRRAAQLWSKRPDLKIEPVRGNVQTRLSKLDDQLFDAIVLAEAGLVRLNLGHLAALPFGPSEMLPAPGQGALGIEVRSDDTRAIESVGQLEDHDARMAVTAERHLLAELHGGCLAPIAAYASIQSEELSMQAVVLSHHGSQRIDLWDKIEISSNSPEDHLPSADCLAAIKLATRMSKKMIAEGAVEIINRETK